MESSRILKTTFSQSTIMTDDSLDLFEQTFWAELKEFADEIGVSPRYVEEEFCLEGLLVKRYPNPVTDNED